MNKITPKDIDDLESIFMALARRYSHLEFLCVVRVADSNEVFITGNSCVVCVGNAIQEFYKAGEIDHISNETSDEDKETKH